MDIEYRLDGPADAPLLVLSNSLGTAFEMWRPQLPALSERFRVLRYNPRGHGTTPLPTAPLRLDTLGNDVIALLDHLDAPVAHFCGISMGGLTGLWLNRYHPQRIGRLVVANTAARIGSAEGWQQRAQQVRERGLAPIAAASPARWFSEAFVQRHPEQVAPLVAALAAGNPQGYAACCDALAQADLRAETAAMSRPMRVIAGEWDPVTTVADAEFLVANAPHAELQRLPASHISNIACPELFNRSVVGFLTEKE
ncbi:3-oxoadipate enol-lactonase [Serratia ficaria]|uniref:3-oxoadipate enol-lactonase 2 n=1 Tax=Serratia ficaria TaxID=61651 RepID=A0A240C5Z3_SERFI|nr:3-oxoadipate enol-lactonase [Serratia ficaria]REF44149.1 3-oxoadipate enol-lactonase [Serratia ficaria]CAI0748795.1 3-oxoadipate enol-lactonase 2 [Serratia ficaria]CAI0763325.1 3-oxoadipate enol-lactonase 2 [Serratia ficaria]CAI0775631.1 3-oxoadipate enol-lactonase 2 [Serratia ficaria]CAI1579037.1 3-oxoadipate enol-lactonase 2 [Serratia ficaria]